MALSHCEILHVRVSVPAKQTLLKPTDTLPFVGPMGSAPWDEFGWDVDQFTVAASIAVRFPPDHLLFSWIFLGI